MANDANLAATFKRVTARTSRRRLHLSTEKPSLGKREKNARRQQALSAASEPLALTPPLHATSDRRALGLAETASRASSTPWNAVLARLQGKLLAMCQISTGGYFRT